MSDSKKLITLEKLIDKNIKAAWYQNGLILMKIRDERLYEKKYTTFENYLETRWEFGQKRRGYQIINAADLTQKIAFYQAEILTDKDEKSAQIVHFLPSLESHLRPLIDSLKTDSERIAVWKNVVYDSQGDEVKITAAYVQNKVDEFIASGEVIEDIEFETKGFTSATLATLNTGDEESYTPEKYLESARLVMGSIDLDPASNPMAQKNVNADIYYTQADDGLTKQWKGKVWMNPPYTARIINIFLEKLVSHFENNEVTEAIVLTNNNTDTSWFHKSAQQASAICFTAGRINFLKRDGSTSSPTNGQSFFYFGNNPEVFNKEFSQYGLVMVKA
jgi:phage N-6-adenine-methyltransferase